MLGAFALFFGMRGLCYLYWSLFQSRNNELPLQSRMWGLSRELMHCCCSCSWFHLIQLFNQLLLILLTHSLSPNWRRGIPWIISHYYHQSLAVFMASEKKGHWWTNKPTWWFFFWPRLILACLSSCRTRTSGEICWKYWVLKSLVLFAKWFSLAKGNGGVVFATQAVDPAESFVEQQDVLASTVWQM